VTRVILIALVVFIAIGVTTAWSQSEELPSPSPTVTVSPTASPTEPSASPDPVAPPVINGVQPSDPNEWSYIAISGSGFMDRTGGCQVTLSGAAAYVSTCAADHIIAIVPWGATSGDVVVSADGVKSRGFPVEVTARSRSSDAYASESLVPGIIEVKLAAGADEETIALRNQGSPEDFVEDASLDHWYRVSVPVGQEVPKAAAYGGDPDVLYSSPLSLPESGDAPNDELYSQQWGLSQISAEAAWTRSKGDGITIAVIDTGFATGHPDLGPHMLPGWNCNQTSDVLPLSSHGTQVAGVAAAYTNNGPGSGSGIAGVGWNSRILPLRLNTMDGLGTCNTSEESFLIMKAIAGGAKVVNMSYSYPTWPRESVCETMRRAANVGLVLVSSAGNSNSSAPVAPATCSEVIAVGATGPDNSKASYSNFGSWLDISAPGWGRRWGATLFQHPRRSYSNDKLSR